MRVIVCVLFLTFTIGPAFAKDVLIEWDPYTDPGSIDGLVIEYSDDINNPNAWVQVNTTLPGPY